MGEIVFLLMSAHAHSACSPLLSVSVVSCPPTIGLKGEAQGDAQILVGITDFHGSEGIYVPETIQFVNCVQQGVPLVTATGTFVSFRTPFL